jgi:DNA-binding MarR family transcriptional regulator
MTDDAPPPHIHPLDGYLGYHLRRAATFMQADLADRLAEVDLTMVEMSALLVIEVNPLIIQSEIGRLLAIKRANMAPLTAALEARGLIERTAVDRRSHGLKLTEKGQALVAKIHKGVNANEARLFERIPEGEREGLVESLRRVWEG